MIENKSAPTIEEIYNKYDNDKEWSNKYSPFKKNNIFCAHEKERALLSMLKQYGFAECIHEKKILEIGAGTGNNCLQMISYGYIPENIYCN
ncbi:MAG: hypothetical protein RR954_09365, partial [Christensenellaceae bacterium]